MKPKTIIRISDQSDLKEAAKKFAEGKADAAMSKTLSYSEGTNIGCLRSLLVESYDISERGDSLLGNDTGVVDKEQKRLGWLLGALTFILQDKPVRLSSLAMLQKAPEIILTAQAYYLRKVERSVEVLEESELALNKQIDKERTLEGFLRQHALETKELFGRRPEDKETKLSDNKDYRERMLTIASVRSGKMSPAMLGPTEAKRKLVSKCNSLSHDIERNSNVLRGIEKLSADALELAAVATHNLHFQVRKLNPANDNTKNKGASRV